MIEIISVLVIIGIISAVVVSRVSSRDSYFIASETAMLSTHLRYAQSRAMGDNVSWGIDFSADGTSYELQRYGAPTTTSTLPGEPLQLGGQADTHVFEGSVTVSNAPDLVSFDVWGSPGIATITITLSVGDESQTITVTKNTGFIP